MAMTAQKPRRGEPKSERAKASAVATRPLAAIVPPGSIAGRALVAVLAIMCFLACLAVGAVTLVLDAARDWQAEVTREVTIQVLPRDGVEIEKELAKASDLARKVTGVRAVRVLTKAENRGLLEPWLGRGVELEGLPVPRLIVVETLRSVRIDFAALQAALDKDVKGAILDDHRQWHDRLAAMTRAVVAIGIGILVLVLAATALSVVFATRGAMASNRDIVEVLHLVGAEDRFIADEFQRRFMRLGFEGGVIGGITALIGFHLAGGFARGLSGDAGAVQIEVLFGSLAIGWNGAIGIVLTVMTVAAIAAVTSRWTVRRYLHAR